MNPYFFVGLAVFLAFDTKFEEITVFEVDGAPLAEVPLVLETVSSFSKGMKLGRNVRSEARLGMGSRGA